HGSGLIRAASGDALLERDEGPGHHALAAEEREHERVVAREERAHGVDARFPEALADRLEQRRPDAAEAIAGLHADAEHPAARRRAELPVAHLADDVADHPALHVADEKMTGRGK